MDKLLTMDELASKLNVDKGYVYKLSYENKIPGKIVLGHRTVRYDPQAIENWIKDRARTN